MFSSSDLLATNAPIESGNIDDLRTPEGDLHILFTIPSGDTLALPGYWGTRSCGRDSRSHYASAQYLQSATGDFELAGAGDLGRGCR